MKKSASVRSTPTEAALQLLPLGGVGRIGMNAMLLGYGDDFVLLDCGVMFPEPEQTGVELLIPSLDLLGKYKSRLRAIVVTHGHEDHIGAIPYVLRVAPVPVYATRFTAGLIRHKLREHSLVDKTDLQVVAPGTQVQVGPFDFDFLRVTHSIPDCVSLSIGTPLGRMIFTGDFKIEEGLRDGIVFDKKGFAAAGDAGVLLMCSDSTNAEVPGHSGNERDVQACLTDVFGECKGRIIVGLFASNIYRLHAVVEAARKNGRYCVLLGRSLHTYVANTNENTDIPFDPEDFIEPRDISKYDPDELVLICTGSQGEPRAALARLANGSHPDTSVVPGDTLVLSARQIPGNERRIHAMLNDFARRGARIVYTRTHRGIHASGHAYSDELSELLALVRPKFFWPVHGEYTFLQRHGELAKAVGVERVLLAENGQRVEVRADSIAAVDQLDATPWFADGLQVGDADSIELKARTQLAWNGAIAVSMLLTRERGVVTGKVTVKPYGVFQGKPGATAAENELTQEVEKGLTRWLQDLDARTPQAGIEGQIQVQVRRLAKRFTTRKPVVLGFVRWLDDGVDSE